MSIFFLTIALLSPPLSKPDWIIDGRAYTCGLKSSKFRTDKEWHFYSLFVSGTAEKNTVVFSKLEGLSKATNSLPANIRFENLLGNAVFADGNLESVKLSGVSVYPSNAYTLSLDLAEPLRRNVRELGVKTSLQIGRTKSFGTCEFSRKASLSEFMNNGQAK